MNLSRASSGAFASPARPLVLHRPPLGRSRAGGTDVPTSKTDPTNDGRPAVGQGTPSSPGGSLFDTDKRPVVLFDGVCNLCNGGVNLALDLDPPGRLRFAALQSAAGRALLKRSGRAPDDISSIVLVEEDGAYVKSEAVLRIATYLENPVLPAAAALGMLFPSVLRDVVYDAVARNRYELLGMRDECRLGDAGRFQDRFVAED